MSGLRQSYRAGCAALFATMLVLVPVANAPAQDDAEAISELIVGVYTLAEYAGHGDEPTGRIRYDAGGRMSAMLFPPGREPLTNTTSAEAYRDAMRGVIAYYGTYTIDAEAGTVTHHLEAASNPSWIGDDFVRWYRFEDGNLTLSLNPDFSGTLLWERLPAE